MPGKLTTHVLDLSSGKPAEGMRIELLRFQNAEMLPVAMIITNSDGRGDQPLLTGDSLKIAEYELHFHVADYFRASAHPDAGTFLSIVPIRFRVSDSNANYHVPLLVSPWAYSTYRGS